MPQFHTVRKEADHDAWFQRVTLAGVEFKTARGLPSRSFRKSERAGNDRQIRTPHSYETINHGNGEYPIFPSVSNLFHRDSSPVQFV